MRRKRNKKRKVNRRVLILCEGETEQLYFKGFKSEYREKLKAIDVDVLSGKDSHPDNILREAEKKAKKAKGDNNPYDDIWLVFDHDNRTNIHKTFQQIDDSKYSINIAFSRLAFEIWYLLHFEKTTRPYKDFDDLEKALKPYIRDYKKASGNYFEYLKSRLPDAISNARQLRAHQQPEFDSGKQIYEVDPYTDVDKLVEFLQGL